MSHPARPIPHDPSDLSVIADAVGAPRETDPETNPLGAGRKTLFQKLPIATRKALCSAILGGMGPTAAKEEFGVDQKTFYRYKHQLRDYVDEIATVKSVARKAKLEKEMEWALGVAKKGVEMSMEKQVPLKQKGEVVKTVDPLSGQEQVVMVDRPDMAAMSMFLKDARDAVGQLGELYELTGKGADRKNARRLLREELDSKQEIAAKMLQGQGGGLGQGQQLNVFLVPKLPGVQQYPGLPPGLPPASKVIEVSTEADADADADDEDQSLLPPSPGGNLLDS